MCRLSAHLPLAVMLTQQLAAAETTGTAAETAARPARHASRAVVGAAEVGLQPPAGARQKLLCGIRAA